MTKTLKQIRDYISDGRFIDAMTLLDEVMADYQQLVTKCNELEKEKTAQDDTIHELLEERTELTIENLKIKKLLLRCKPYLSEWIVPMDILAEIDELEEK